MSFDSRSFAVATAGFAAFVNLYSPQALLPELAREFGVGAGEISSLMTAGTAAIALTAPFTGAFADVVGRKRLITFAMFAVVVPTVIMTLVGTVPEFIFWRFVQGLLLPPIFTVAVAYIGDEWPPADVPRIAGLYMVGTSVGGFSGRFIPGVLTDAIGWRAAFGVVALLSLAAAVIVARTLPRERHFVASGGFAGSLRHMFRHLRDPRLLATYAIGFGVLFNFIATFTYVSFHLAAPPYLFSPTLLGGLFFTYLVSSVAVPWVGRAIASCLASSPYGWWARC
jgi:MFS family permease